MIPILTLFISSNMFIQSISNDDLRKTAWIQNVVVGADTFTIRTNISRSIMVTL